MTTKHTPTPWRVDPTAGRILAEDPRQTIVVPSLGGSFSNPEVAADAVFIVRAVNHHEALVAMVKELRMLVRVTGPLTTARERADKLIAAIEAA